MSPPWPECVGEADRKTLDRVFWRWALSSPGQDVLEGLWDAAIAWEKEQPAGLKTDGFGWLAALRKQG